MAEHVNNQNPNDSNKADKSVAALQQQAVELEQAITTQWQQQAFDAVSELLTQREQVLRQQAPMTDAEYIKQRLAFDQHLSAMAQSQKVEWQDEYRQSGKQKVAAMAYKKHL